MATLSEAYQQLLAMGYKPEDIPNIIRLAATPGAAQSFANYDAGRSAINIGTAEQDRADKLAEQARLAQEFRVQTGLGALGLMQTDEQRRDEAEGDPFRFVEFLRGVSQLPQGAAGNPVSSLIGQGFSIKPQLPSDPHYASLLDDMASFGKPRGAAQGAKVAMAEPGVIVGESGKVYTTLNENGPEKLSVTPQKGVSQKLDPRKQQEILDRVLGNVDGMAGGGNFGGLRGLRGLGSLRMPQRTNAPQSMTRSQPTSAPAMPEYPATPIPSGRGGPVRPFPLPDPDKIREPYRGPLPIDPNPRIPKFPRLMRDTLGGQGPGDLNGDGVINPGDQAIASHRTALLQSIADIFGSMQGQPNFNAAYDLNHDGRINSLDSQAAARWRPGTRMAGGVSGGPVYGMAAGGSFGNWANARRTAQQSSQSDRDRDIQRLAATPGAAEAFANYDRQRNSHQSDVERLAATPGAAEAFAAYDANRAPTNTQDPSFGSSTSTTARPNGQVAYIHTADGRVEAVANPVGLGPGNWENVVGPDGVGHWQPIDESRTRQLAQETQQAYFDRMHALGSGEAINTPQYQNLLQILADAGGRKGSIMPSMALANRQRSPYVTYPAAYPGGPNIINIQGNGTKGLGAFNKTAQQTGGTYNTTLYNGHYGHADPNYRDDTYRPGMAGGGSVSPAQAAAMAMGKALANNPFAPTELIRDLQAGNAANPAHLNQRLRANIDPNLWQGLLSTNQGFGYRPDSVLASAQQYDIPTFNSYYKVGG